jgi:hypothetical protein
VLSDPEAALSIVSACAAACAIKPEGEVVARVPAMTTGMIVAEVS